MYVTQKSGTESGVVSGYSRKLPTAFWQAEGRAGTEEPAPVECREMISHKGGMWKQQGREETEDEFDARESNSRLGNLGHYPTRIAHRLGPSAEPCL